MAIGRKSALGLDWWTRIGDLLEKRMALATGKPIERASTFNRYNLKGPPTASYGRLPSRDVWVGGVPFLSPNKPFESTINGYLPVGRFPVSVIKTSGTHLNFYKLDFQIPKSSEFLPLVH